MTWIESRLLPGETVLYSAKLHWLVYIPMVATLPFLLLGLLWAFNLSFFVGLPFISIGLWGTAKSLIDQHYTCYSVTNCRIVRKEGFIRLDMQEINLRALESTYTEQSIIERILGLGTVVACGTGSTELDFPAISDPVTMQQAINEARLANP